MKLKRPSLLPVTMIVLGLILTIAWSGLLLWGFGRLFF
jgi:hypothetical protein